MTRGKLGEDVRLFRLCLRRVAVLSALTSRIRQESRREAADQGGLGVNPQLPLCNEAPTTRGSVRTAADALESP